MKSNWSFIMKKHIKNKVSVEQTLWQVIKTASEALLQLRGAEQEYDDDEDDDIEDDDMSIPPIQPRMATASHNTMRNRLNHLHQNEPPVLKTPLKTELPKKKPIVATQKTTLSDDKIKHFAVRIANEISPKVKNEDYDLVQLFNTSTTWDGIKDNLDKTSIRGIITQVDTHIQDRLEQKMAQEQERKEMQRLAQQERDMELKKQKVAQVILSQRGRLLDKVANEILPLIKKGGADELNKVVLSSNTWNSIKNDLPSNEKSAFLKDLLKKADFQRDVMPVGRPSANFSTGTQTNKQDSGTMPQGVLNGGLSAPDNPVNRARNLDHGEAYGKKPSTALNNFSEVYDNPMSGRVIPSNKGYANNTSALDHMASAFESDEDDFFEDGDVELPDLEDTDFVGTDLNDTDFEDDLENAKVVIQDSGENLKNLSDSDFFVSDGTEEDI
jgi:hypothetical protein